MKLQSIKHKRNITLSFLIIMLCFLNITFLGAGISSSSKDTSALTYSNTTGLSFTFKPTLSISLSSSTINIANLVPGQVADSDPITVSVSSNTPYGYSLFASVGSSDTASTYYNTSDLIHEDATLDTISSAPSFTSIATNANLATLTEDNTWGYSYKSTAEGSTWSVYNGLPLYSTVGDNTSTENPAKLIDTKDSADSTKAIDFKLAAKASNTQASGTYNNVINFYAVGKPEPQPIDLATAFAASGAQKTTQGYYRMQDMTSDICNSVDVIHSTIELQDVRDNEVYTVAKLKDNKCWMTKNLNLKGGAVITSELSNVPDNYTLPTANGFKSGNKLPASSTSGFNDDTKAFVYNSTKTSGIDCTSPGCYSYYSWTAATAGSGLSITADDTDALYSICPKGWKLPSTRTTSVADWKTESDFYKLAVAYGMDPSSTSQTTINFVSQAGPGTTPNFLLTGYYLYGSFDLGGYAGYYWSSTSRDSTIARYLIFNSSDTVNSASSAYRKRGAAVRCIAE